MSRCPLPPALEVVRHGHALGMVTDPVHQAQRGVVERALAEMVLHQDMVPAHARRLAKQPGDVVSMVQRIHKHAAVDRVGQPGPGTPHRHDPDARRRRQRVDPSDRAVLVLLGIREKKRAEIVALIARLQQWEQ